MNAFKWVASIRHVSWLFFTNAPTKSFTHSYGHSVKSDLNLATTFFFCLWSWWTFCFCLHFINMCLAEVYLEREKHFSEFSVQSLWVFLWSRLNYCFNILLEWEVYWCFHIIFHENVYSWSMQLLQILKT